MDHDETDDQEEKIFSSNLQQVLGQALKEKFLGKSSELASHFELPKVAGKMDTHPFYLKSGYFMENFFYGTDPDFQSNVIDYFYTETDPDNFAKNFAVEHYGYQGPLLGGETKIGRYDLRKIATMLSSAALICNILGRPRLKDKAFMKVSLKEGPLPQGNYEAYLECPMRTLHKVDKNGKVGSPTHPAMADAFLRSDSNKTAIVLENKMVEYLSSNRPALSSPSYLNRLAYWPHGEPYTHAPERFIELIKTVNAKIANFEIGFDALQLIKHAIGIYNELDPKSGNPLFDGIRKVYLVNSVWAVPLDSSVWNGQEKLKDQYQEKWAAEEDSKAREELGVELNAILHDCYPTVDFYFVFMTAKDFANSLDLEGVKNQQGLSLKEYLQRYWL
jgi:hypothetical protein